MASISGRGIGVKPCIFLADSIHIVCIQEGNVLVSVHHMGVNSSPWKQSDSTASNLILQFHNEVLLAITPSLDMCHFYSGYM